MNKLLSNVPPFQFVSVGKNWTETFLKQSWWVVNCSKSTESLWRHIWVYCSNVNSKNKISVFLLAFSLYHLNSHISIKTITVYFSRIVNIDIYTWIYMNIDIYTETVWTLCQAMAENEYTKSERKLRKFVSFTRLSFVSRPLLINLKGFRTTWWKI